MTIITKSSPPSLTVLGFDFGLKKIGIATGQTITRTASPLEIIRVEKGEILDHDLFRLLKTWRPQALIVGMPQNMDDSPSPLTEIIQQFAHSLATRSHLPVHFVDERLTTRTARYELEDIIAQTKTKPKDYRLDAFAACLIVETWLQAYP